MEPCALLKNVRGSAEGVRNHNGLAGVADVLREIAGLLGNRGYGAQIAHLIGIAIALPTEHEECPVVAIVKFRDAERTADDPAKLILFEG
jgi:hypothetical protein